MAGSFKMTRPTPVQLVETGHVWNSVVKKKATIHTMMIPIRMFAARMNLDVTNICL